ncbi:MAG: hypothetical protein GC162_05270 [Planctomycetes bacterium]|nr:hypothetical protein [Planctomycetota bacterium]
MNTNSDRRFDSRQARQCPVKIFDPLRRRYASGVSRNLSHGGALIELTSPITIRAGEAVGVAVDLTGGRAVVRMTDLVAATVVRRDTDDSRARLIAVRYVCPQSMGQTVAAEADRRAA